MGRTLDCGDLEVYNAQVRHLPLPNFVRQHQPIMYRPSFIPCHTHTHPDTHTPTHPRTHTHNCTIYSPDIYLSLVGWLVLMAWHVLWRPVLPCLSVNRWGSLGVSRGDGGLPCDS